MNIFISWSGNRSKLLAESLRDWLPNVIQKLKPWMSASDIDKGSRWLKEISEKLESTNFGIICLTPENLNEPWILFEAGALSKAIDNSMVCPILLDLDPSLLKGPLSQFQATQGSRDDISKLLGTLNRNLEDGKLTEKRLEEAFTLWWPKLESQIHGIPSTDPKLETRRSTEDILLEILRIVRGLDRNSTQDTRIREIVEEILPSLSPREEKVLRMRFGLGEQSDTNNYHKFVSEIVDSRLKNRIAQIEGKAARKLSRPKQQKPT